MSKKKVEVRPGAQNAAGKISHSFRVVNDALFKQDDRKEKLIANFHLLITAQVSIIDGDRVKEKLFELTFKKATRSVPFIISAVDFFSHRLFTRIMNEIDPQAVLYGSLKDLRTAAQELSSPNIPEKKIVAISGFDLEGNFHCGALLVTPKGFQKKGPPGVELETGHFARNLGFLMPEKSKLRALAGHILRDVLWLKSPKVTYPLIGHIALAPFTSAATEITGKEKVAMHLQGSSGCGKTFLGTLAMSFFGKFDGTIPSWSSTANAIEAEGYWFRDGLFLVDDYKAAFVPQETVVRVFQGYADGHGRLRLKSNARTQDHRYIRGLLLSTGEDFVSDIESVTGRTICLQVEPEKNEEAGKRCWEMRHTYPMFLPGLVQMIISRPGWKEWVRTFVDEKIAELAEETRGLSNGLRIASNWALNALGFHLFISYLGKLGAIDRNGRRRVEREYDSIVRSHLRDQANKLQSESPDEVFFRIIGQKMASGGACITGLNGAESKPRGRSFGFVKGSSALVLPDVVMEILSAHFRGVGQRMPFTKNSLRNVLAQSGLIARPKEGRWARQVRGEDGTRVNVWDFDLEDFKAKTAVV